MTDTTASGAASAAPGWYADPNDPDQLRWWSGQAWTEHVSPKNPPAVADAAPAAEQSATEQSATEQSATGQSATGQAGTGQPDTEQAATPQPATEQSAPEQSALGQSAPETDDVAAIPATVDPAPLPSRRALREAGIDAVVPQRVVAQTQVPAETADPISADASAADLFSAEPGTAPAEPIPALSTAPAAPSPSDATADTGSEEYAAPVSAAPAAPTAWSQPSAPSSDVASPEDSQQPGQFSIPPQYSQPVAPVIQPGGSPQAMPGFPALAMPPLDEATIGGSVPSVPSEDPTRWPLGPASGSRAEAGDSDAETRSAGSTTTNVWTYLVAVTPIIAAAATIYVIAANSYVISGWMLPVALAAPYLLGILFAVADGSRLATEGVERPTPWWWAALTAPVYLIQRAGEARRETGTGGPGLIVWFVCFLVAIAAIVCWGFIAHHALFAGLPS